MEDTCIEELVPEKLFEDLLRSGRLFVDPVESEILRKELNSQLKIISLLDSVPLPDMTDPVVHGNPFPAKIRCDLREDIWIPFDHPEEIIAQAPVHRDGFIVSPDVPHQRIG